MSDSPKISNAKEMPKVFYGMHFYPGVAEYAEPNAKPYRILLNEDTLRDMDATFEGKPVYVRHVDEVNMDKLQEEADGYVIQSFYNRADGKHWVKFIAVSDKCQQAIRNGWRLSNAYIPKSFAGGGQWNGVDYVKEVVSGTFEHLAVVPDPRYQDSIILTPEQFKEYCEEKEVELKRVANSKTRRSMFEFFKRTKVDNSDEITDAVVKLPTSGKEVTIGELIKLADAAPVTEAVKNSPVEEHAEAKASEDRSGDKKSMEEKEKQGDKPEEKGAAPQMANMDHHVMVGNDSKPLHEVMKDHMEMKQCMQAMAKHGMKNDEQMDGGEKDAKAAEDADLTQRNADKDGGEKEADKQLAESDKTKRNAKFFEELKNAPEKSLATEGVIDLDQVARGRARYGSEK